MSKQILVDVDVLRDLAGESPSLWAKHEARKLLQPTLPIGTVCTHEKYGDAVVVDVLEKDLVTVFAKARNPELITVDQSELKYHPTTLFEQLDFENAPEGTIIAPNNPMLHLRIKDSGYWLCDDEGNQNTNLEMAKLGPWNVIRWGHGQ